MKNIVLLGDSITDMGRDRNDTSFSPSGFGFGYPFFIEGALSKACPKEYAVYNRGVGGDRSVDIYARIKRDCWNLRPDIVSLFVGVNDVWHGACCDEFEGNGVEIDRYEKFLRMILEETAERFPRAKFIVMAPFAGEGVATAAWTHEKQDVKEYAAVTKKVAKEKGAAYVDLQATLDPLAEKYGWNFVTKDGVHPTVAGSNAIAEAWLNAFETLK